MKALVTGASSGIGRDIARYLSKKGYDIIAVARNDGALSELKNELSTNVEVIPTDLSNVKNCIELYNKVKEQNIDILINCAGFGAFGSFTDIELERDIDMINTNITALHVLLKLFLKDMKNRNSGYILNVASIAGFMPGPLMAEYYASKAYVVRLTQAIYEELKKEKSSVKISVLCPGPVATNFNSEAGVKFGIKQVTSEFVAKYAIDKMFKGKLIILPTMQIKLARFGSKMAPEKLVAKIAYRMQKRKNG